MVTSNENDKKKNKKEKKNIKRQQLQSSTMIYSKIQQIHRFTFIAIAPSVSATAIVNDSEQQQRT